MDITLIELNRIKPNNYNPNVMSEDILAKLRAEIAHKGVCVPIIVRNRGEGYEIVDGEHRWRICQELGWEKMPCIVQDFDDNEAKIKTLQLNYLSGDVLPIKLAHLIHDLSKEVSIEELEKRLPYEKVELKDSLELLKLPEDYGTQIRVRESEEEKNLPRVITFVAYEQEAKLIEEAIDKALNLVEEGVKNRKVMALAKICSEYLVREWVMENHPIAVKT